MLNNITYFFKKVKLFLKILDIGYDLMALHRSSDSILPEFSFEDHEFLLYSFKPQLYKLLIYLDKKNIHH